MLTLWFNLSARVCIEVRRLWLETIPHIVAVYFPPWLSERTQSVNCHACTTPMERICSPSGYPDYSRCPCCGLIRLRILTVRPPRQPVTSRGIISLAQRRNAKGH